MFRHHTVANLNNDKHTPYKFYVEMLEIFDLTYAYNKMKVSYERNTSLTLQENDFHFRYQSYGIGFNIFNLRVEVGIGNWEL
jgi:hypothetical protein